MVLNFSVNVPTTWGKAASVLFENDPKLGRVRESKWENLPERKAATHPMLVLRVERLDAQGNLRVSKPQRIVTPAGNQENPVPVKTDIPLLKNEQHSHAKNHLLRFKIKAFSYFWQVSY